MNVAKVTAKANPPGTFPGFNLKIKIMKNTIKEHLAERLGEYLTLSLVLLSAVDFALIGLAFMVIVEAILGASLAKRKGVFSWREFARSFTKIIWFGLGLLSAAVANHFVILSFIDWVQLCAGIMAAYELRQIWGKIDELSGTHFLTTIRDILDSRILNITRKAKEEKPKDETN